MARTGHRFVLLGRERVLEDLAVAVEQADLGVEWVEISHFDRTRRQQYIDERMTSVDVGNSAYIAARDVVIGALEGTVNTKEGEAFVGYAPVLDAVVALLGKGNHHQLEQTFANAATANDRISVLVSILEKLLDREHEKVAPLRGDLDLPALAYGRQEQIDWLLHELHDLPPPPLEWCPEEARSTYVKRVGEFLRDHPFLSDRRWASPVFSSFVGALAFGRKDLRESLQRIGAESGLLFEFVNNLKQADLIDEWQFAALHASLLSAEWRQAATLVEVEGGVEGLAAPETVTGTLRLIEREGAVRKIDVTIMLERAGELVLMGPAASIDVRFPGAVVLRPGGTSLPLGPDCYIRCLDLRLDGGTIEVSRAGAPSEQGATVTFEVEGSFNAEGILTGEPSPAVLELFLPVEVAIGYPWITYRRVLEPSPDLPDERTVQFLNMLMRLARVHGHRGGPAVFDQKLEGRQSIKGERFHAVIDALQVEGILHREGAMIILDTDKRFSGKQGPGLRTLDQTGNEWTPTLSLITSILR